MDLDDTAEDLEAEVTPIADLAADIRTAIDERVTLTPREAELRDAFVDVAAARLARHLENAHRATSATPRRLAQLEAWRADVDPWRLRIAGVAERNGRLGRLDQDVADLREDLGTGDERRAERAELAALRADVGTPEERQAERRIVRGIRWTTAKVLALIAAAGTLAGGGLWQTLRARADAREAIARAQGQRDQHEIDQDRSLERLFTICTRTP